MRSMARLSPWWSGGIAGCAGMLIFAGMLAAAGVLASELTDKSGDADFYGLAGACVVAAGVCLLTAALRIDLLRWATVFILGIPAFVLVIGLIGGLVATSGSPMVLVAVLAAGVDLLLLGLAIMWLSRAPEKGDDETPRMNRRPTD